MTGTEGDLEQFSVLRRQAETILKDRIALSSSRHASLSAADALRALQELSIHQIELEMQNEELHRALAEVDAGKERYSNFYDLSPAGFCSLSDQGTFLEANLTLAGMLDLPQRDLVGLSFARFIAESSIGIYNSSFHKLIDFNEPQSFDIQMLNMLGGTFWVHIASTALINTKGSRVCRLVVSDISELIQANEALRVSEDQFNSAFHALPIAACITDFNSGCILAINHHYSDVYGYAENELLGHTATELGLWARPEDRAQVLAMVQAGLPVHGHELQVRRKDGSLRWISYSVDKVRLHGADCLLSGAVDISQRKAGEATILRMQAKLEQRVKERTAELEAANLELEAFSYSVSHDLRNPLQTIKGFSDVLMEEYQDQLDEIVKKYLSRIRLGAERMTEIIEDLLKLSKANRSKLTRAELDLSGLCGRVAEALAMACQDGRQVEVCIQPGMSVRADPNLLQIVMENTLGNAWKFTARTGQPRIAVGEAAGPGGERTFFIKDNGAGFDMAQAGKLFQVFQRLHSTAEFEGTGIGLTIAQRIIDRHGGRIWAEAEPEKGATFFFTLPEPVEP